MARFLKALQGLQSLEPVTSGKSPEVGDVSEEANYLHERSSLRSTAHSDAEAISAPSQTIVMTEEAKQPSVDKDGLVKKLAQQLASVLKQRDVVAQEMLLVREKLASNEQRHEKEIVRLQETLLVQERSAKAIESELKSLEAVLRQQLSLQQEAFVQRLDEVERQVKEQAERPLPEIPETSNEAELREFQNELRQQMVREQEIFVQRLAEIEKRIAEQELAATKQFSGAPGIQETELAAIQAELQKQMARQQEEFVRRISEVEKLVRKHGELPKKNEKQERSPESTRSKSGTEEIFRPHTRSGVVAKAIPNTNLIDQAIASFNNPAMAKEFDQLAQEIFGTIDFQNVSVPEVIYFGTCLPGQSSGGLVVSLAAWLSQHACNVLIIDGALRKKELSTQLGLQASPGLFEFVRRETYRQDGTYRHASTGIGFIPAGKSSFVLTAGEADFSSLRDQLAEIVKTFPIVLITGEGPDLSASWLLAQAATKTYLQAPLGQLSAEEVQAAVDCYLRSGVEPTGLIVTNAQK